MIISLVGLFIGILWGCSNTVIVPEDPDPVQLPVGTLTVDVGDGFVVQFQTARARQDSSGQLQIEGQNVDQRMEITIHRFKGGGIYVLGGSKADGILRYVVSYEPYVVYSTTDQYTVELTVTKVEDGRIAGRFAGQVVDPAVPSMPPVVLSKGMFHLSYQGP